MVIERSRTSEMAKWKNGNGPILWPIDMSQINRVNFVATPQTDIKSALTDIEYVLSEEAEKYPECPTFLETDTPISKLIDVLCKRLSRRTPSSIGCDKGNLNTDVLRSVLEKTISTVSMSDKYNLDGSRKKGEQRANNRGIFYDDLSDGYIDVEYETIFGGTKVVIAKYGPNTKTIIIEAKCEQCLVMRDSDGSIVNFGAGNLHDMELQNTIYVNSVDSTMIYFVAVTINGTTINTDKLTIRRPLEFIIGTEHLAFLEDGPEQNVLPTQKVEAAFYLDYAKFSITGTNGQLEFNGITLDLGSMRDCKANIVKTFFKRKNSNLRKQIEAEDVYNTMQDKTEQWTEPGVAKTFCKTLNAAKNKLNSDIATTFKLGDVEVFQQKERRIFINPDYLSPQKKN